MMTGCVDAHRRPCQRIKAVKTVNSHNSLPPLDLDLLLVSPSELNSACFKVVSVLDISKD